MKISELTTKDAASVMCVCATHISAFATDEELVSILEKGKLDTATSTNAEIIRNGTEITSKIITLLLEKHYNDVCEVLAALQRTTAKKIESQNILETFAQIKDVVEDDAFWDFFKPLVGLVRRG